MVWSIPTLTIILLGGVAWIGAHQLDPLAPVAGSGKPLTIQAVSLDWKWLFIYPDQSIATINTHENERIVVITPTRGLFYCFDAKVGGDCLALVQHITGLEVQDAAQFLAPKEATAPQAGRVEPTAPKPTKTGGRL